MSRDDQIRWDRQHGAAPGPDAPSSFLAEIFASATHAIAAGRALDLACGKGRNALFLAERGFDVLGIDVSDVALGEARTRAREKSLAIAWQQADLEQIRLPQNSFDLVINFNYLQRSLMPQLKAAIKNAGYVICETYLVDQQTIGHPKNPDYLLAHNELLEQFRDFRVLYYREGKFLDGGGLSFRAGILAQKVR
jgi:SAM-dependent methyltransferase